MTDTPDDFDTWLVASDTTAQTVPDDVWDATLAGSFDDSYELDDDLTVPPGEEANGTVDGTEVDGDEAKPMEVTPSGEEVRSDDGGEPELGGDGGEKVRRCGLDSDGEERRRVAETEEKSTGDAYIAPGGGERGRRGRKRARRSRPPLKTPAKLAGLTPNESEREREGKAGESGEGIAGNDSPLIMARGEGGMRRNPRRRRR